MCDTGRKYTGNDIIVIGIFTGLVLGFGTDLIVYLSEL